MSLLDRLTEAQKAKNETVTEAVTDKCETFPLADMKAFLTNISGPESLNEGDVPSNVFKENRAWDSFNVRRGKSPALEKVLSSSEGAAGEYLANLKSVMSSEERNLLTFSEIRFICEKSIQTNCWDGLKIMVESKMANCSVCPRLIPTLIKANSKEVLLLSLEKIEDIKESNIVDILKWALKSTSMTIEFYGPYKKVLQDPKVQYDRFESTKNFMNAIISYPTTEVFLQKALRSLSRSETMLVFEHLREWARVYGKVLGFPRDYEEANKIPTYAQVVSWLTILIDAKLVDLIQDPRASSIFQELRQLTTSDTKLVGDLDRGIFNLAQGTKKPKSHSHGNYFIERIQL